jgi:hypothetical protein
MPVGVAITSEQTNRNVRAPLKNGGRGKIPPTPRNSFCIEGAEKPTPVDGALEDSTASQIGVGAS